MTMLDSPSDRDYYGEPDYPDAPCPACGAAEPEDCQCQEGEEPLADILDDVNELIHVARRYRNDRPKAQAKMQSDFLTRARNRIDDALEMLRAQAQ